MDQFIYVNFAYEDRKSVSPFLERLKSAGINYVYNGNEENVARSIFVLDLCSAHSRSSKTFRKNTNHAVRHDKDSIRIHIADTSIESDIDAQLHVLEELFKYKYKDSVLPYGADQKAGLSEDAGIRLAATADDETADEYANEEIAADKISGEEIVADETSGEENVDIPAQALAGGENAEKSAGTAADSEDIEKTAKAADDSEDAERSAGTAADSEDIEKSAGAADDSEDAERSAGTAADSEDIERSAKAADDPEDTGSPAKSDDVIALTEREIDYKKAMEVLGKADADKEVDAALMLLVKSANQGYAPAQYELSVCYDEGKGVRRNKFEAVRWREMAAYSGMIKAQTEMGYCYESGQGVVRNIREAVRWYRMASEQGDMQAKNNLAFCYQKGRGVLKDTDKAIKLYTEAADAGLASAQYNLGYCYWYGEGIEADKPKAIELFRKSMAGGNNRAYQMMRVLDQYRYFPENEGKTTN